MNSAVQSSPAGESGIAEPPILRVAFLIGGDHASTRMAIDAVCRIPNIRPVGIFVDTARPGRLRRMKNLLGNIGANGISYVFHRLGEAINEALEARASCVVPEEDVNALLQKAFPDECFTLRSLAERFGCKVHAVGNLNGPLAAEKLKEAKADLGIVLGTRILKKPTFSIPAQGCINLHKGSVPDFRGMPPAFWELYERRRTAGVTVHFVDERLDTGDIVGSLEIPIHRNETEISLRTKLDLEGAALTARCVQQLQSGSARRTPQPAAAVSARTKPTRRQRQELEQRLPNAGGGRSRLAKMLKTALYLSFHRLGVRRWVRWRRRKAGTSRAAIILYHRVNDYSVDPLTASRRRFAEHLLLLKRDYIVFGTGHLVDRLRKREAFPPNVALIHFDDCYEDVSSNAGRLLAAAGLPATAFIASGFIGTDRAFSHDENKYPFRYPNLAPAQVRELLTQGFEIGAHTVNHVNLGQIPVEAARMEVCESRAQLECLTGGAVRFFSFPFGRIENIRPEVQEAVRNLGYDAMFSAHGGFVRPEVDLFDIPRIGVHTQHRPLDLMMEMEGMSIRDIARRFGRR